MKHRVEILFSICLSLLAAQEGRSAEPPGAPSESGGEPAAKAVKADPTAQPPTTGGEEKGTTLQRLALDLYGVPASSEVIRAYEADSAPDALPRALRSVIGKRPWSAEQATGAPDTPKPGDYSTAWAPRAADGGSEWLSLHFDQAVDVHKVVVYESANPGAITKVTARDPMKLDVTLAEDASGLKKANSNQPLEVAAPVAVTTKDVQLLLNTALAPGWNEIDAVRLDGNDGSSQWAAQATASSTYADRCPALTPAGATADAKQNRAADCSSCHTGHTGSGGDRPEAKLVLDLNNLKLRTVQVDSVLQRLQTDQNSLKYVDVLVDKPAPPPRRAMLGVNLQDAPKPMIGRWNSATPGGALVAEVIAGSPAERANLRKGDLILRVNGIAIESADALRELISGMTPGTIVVIAYRRGAEEKNETPTAGPEAGEGGGQAGGEQVTLATLVAPPEINVVIAQSMQMRSAAPWSPEQACGAPDTPRLGDFKSAWAPASMDAGTEWLKLEYDRAVKLAGVVIYQSCGPGAVSNVMAMTTNGEVVRMEGAAVAAAGIPLAGADSGEAVPLKLEAPRPGITTQTITVEVDTGKVPGWNEIDAVELIGEDGSRQWASKATASSYFGQSAGPAFRKANSPAELEDRMAQLNARLGALEQRLQKANAQLKLDQMNWDRSASGLQGKITTLRVIGKNQGPRPWSPEQACGEPDTPVVGDYRTAWAPGEVDGGVEWLEVHFDQAVEAAQLQVYESCGDGAIRRITALLPGGAQPPQSAERSAGGEKPWREQPLLENAGDMATAQDGAKTPVKIFDLPGNVRAAVFRIYLDTKAVAGWNEIDAVQLVGRDGSKQWASKARASSTYADRASGAVMLPPPPAAVAPQR